MKLLLILTSCFALAFSVSARADQNKNKKKNQEEQAQPQPQPKANKQAKHLGNQQQQQQHQLNKQGKHLGNQQQQMQHQENKLNKHLGNQEQHAMHQGNKLNKHLGNQEQHQQHQMNKQAKHQLKQFNVSKSANPKIQGVKFKQGNHIAGSQKWQGKKYIVFKNYQSQWHDHGWWNNHHTRIILIGGGYYFWNNNYWYPAWGYDDAYSYYPYDGPIYSPASLDPGQVVANVQSVLQDEGYYQGEIDGLLGPLTRAALAQYQSDHGLYETAAIDEPTLETMGLS